MKRADFLPSNFTLLTVMRKMVKLSNPVGMAQETEEFDHCEACGAWLLPTTGAYFSKDCTLCPGCYNKRLVMFNALSGALNKAREWCMKCSMFIDNAGHTEKHKEVKCPCLCSDCRRDKHCKHPLCAEHVKQATSEPKLLGQPLTQWIKQVLEVHDNAPGIDAFCGRNCKTLIKAKDEAWFLGVSDAAPVICLACYAKDKPKEPPVSAPNTAGYFSTQYSHHKHEPAEMIADADHTWSISVASRDGLVAHANDFDIVMNMSGRTIHDNHIIPIPELAKWKHGPDTFQEMLLDWPDNGVAYFPLQFWLDVVEHISTKKLKLVLNCHGGHGRTGTALACLLIASGVCKKGTEAIEWTRKNHCDRAIESKEQEEYIHVIAKAMKAHLEVQ